ncbi:MAG: LPS export ABC transporter periplasmic protein LptC [Treponema sp.]|nr:LPS export ABC transporter periplasmic protein LptC [Spirochaetia bacterium]MDY4769002.1 LPS export ABC transporter periplasmic protein LptC [Treponema sp.]
MKKRILAITISSLFIFLGCSLKYSQSYQDESNVPEFIFTDAVYTKYEDDAKKLSLSAGVLEQYKEGNSMYARDVSFQLLKKTGEIETEGSCKLLSANSDEEKYTLYDDIKIKNFDENLEVTAGSIRWNGKSEQLTSSRNDMVTIKKGDTTMQGSGFSASAISKKFAFTGVITGEFEKNEDSDNNSKEEVSVSVESEK